MKDMLKKIAISLFLLPLVGGLMLSTATTKTRAAADDFDAAAVYKAKCAMCHTGNAGKFFDPTGKTDDVLADTILKGKKGEKPPFMPAFSEKGISADQAKALVTYMKSLKQ
jgi:mono/diheme cytochrome c family protein